MTKRQAIWTLGFLGWATSVAIASCGNKGDDTNTLAKGEQESEPNPCETVLAGQCGDSCVDDLACSAGLHCNLAGTCVATCVTGQIGCGDGVCTDAGRCLGPACTQPALSDACGQLCTTDDDCAAGTHCGSSAACTADCTPDGPECPDGRVCTPGGRCVEPGVALDAGTSSDAEPVPADGDVCASTEVDLSKQIPTVVVLVDRSGSMTEPFGDTNRWDAVYDALLDPQTGIFEQLANDVRFGMVLYSGQNDECPQLTSTVDGVGSVGLGADHVQAMRDSWPDSPGGDTPTGDAIDAVMTWYATYDEPGPKIIVLATDGLPDTCETPNPQCNLDNGTEVEACDESISAVARAHEVGVETYVISVGDDVGERHLQEIANVGLGQPTDTAPPAAFWEATDPGGLAEAFNTIVNGVRDCLFILDGEIAEGFEDQGTVTLDGELLDYGADYEVALPNEVRLVGVACDTIKSGEHIVDVEFPCEGFVPGPIH